MKTTLDIITRLIELQGLVGAKLQKRAVQPNAKLDELNGQIASLSTELPPQVKSHFDRLLKKHPEAIVQIIGERCTGCNMALTRSFVQSVRKAVALNRCSNCARFLYYSEQMVEREPTKRIYGEESKGGIFRYTRQELMMVNLKGTTGREVLSEMCAHMADEKCVKNGGHLLKLALKREKINSTATEGGLAFPHVYGVEGGGLFMAVGTSRKGIKFGGSGRTLTRIFFFIIGPTATSGYHLRLIADLSRTFRDKDAREMLRKAQDNEELWKVLVKVTKKIFR